MSRREDSPGPVDLLLEQLKGVRRHGDFYRAFCPAHDDRNTPNLDIKEGEDGRALDLSGRLPDGGSRRGLGAANARPIRPAQPREGKEDDLFPEN